MRPPPRPSSSEWERENFYLLPSHVIIAPCNASRASKP